MPGRRPPRKSAYHHGDLRAALVAAASAILEADPRANVTLRDIASRVGVSPMATYHHFADKDALLAAVAEEGFRSLHHDLAAAGEREKTGAARLRAMGVAYVKHAVRHPGHFAVMFAPALVRHPDVQPAARRAFEVLEAAARDAHAEGSVAARRISDVCEVVWATAHGVASLWVLGSFSEGSPRSIDAIAKHAVESAVRGLATNEG